MIQHRRILAVSSAIALALPLAACGEAATGSTAVDRPTFEAGTTMDRLAAAGKITVGTKFDLPLFGFVGEDGIPVGFDVEIAKIIAGKLGIAPSGITWVEAPTKSREDYLEQSKVDMIAATYTISSKRKTRVSFAGPYYNAASTLMVASGSRITGPESLKDRRLKACVTTGSVDVEAISGYLEDPASQLVQLDFYSKCAEALHTGQVDAVTTNNAILLGLVEDSAGAFKTVGATFKDQPFGIGIKKGDIAFCEFIKDVLRAADSDGSYEQAWKSTAGLADPMPPLLPKLDECT